MAGMDEMDQMDKMDFGDHIEERWGKVPSRDRISVSLPRKIEENLIFMKIFALQPG